MIRLVDGHNGSELPRLKQRFALAYLDPPFFSGKKYKMKDGELAFDDRWPSLATYLMRLEDVVRETRELLIPEGSLVLHVDTKVSHHAKIMLDRIFGADCFASEIIWRYRRWPSKTLNFQRVHDVLLRYRRDTSVLPRFNQLYEPLAPSTLATWGEGKQLAVVEGGKRLRSSTTAERSRGVPLGDVWDLSVIAPSSKERTGYPTQKPEALLERLVSGLTNPGDWVLDPYCGSATTLAVCKRLKRNAVGIDNSPAAIRVARARLSGAGDVSRQPPSSRFPETPDP